MRKALNERPLVQAALIGLLALGAGLVLLMRMGSSGGPPAETTAPATATDPAAAPAVAASVPAETPSPSGEGVAALPPQPGAFEAGPGLPKDVVDAYDAGKAIVLLVVRHGGIDDRKVQGLVATLDSRSDTAVFVTRAAGIAHYSRITQGLDVDRTPALVAVRPKRLTEGPTPTASVSYGFRGASSVRQALDDALYKGPTDLPYYP